MTETTFSPLEKQQTVAEAISAEILSLLRQKELKPGDKLPPERELAEMLGVSRPSLREALRALSIMKVVDASADAAGVKTADGPAVRQQDMSRTTMHSTSGRSLSGTIAEVPLPDLIQLFSTSKKTGTLVINQDNVVAKLHLDRGRLVYAQISDSPGLDPTKAIYRLLAWEDGTFELLGPEAKRFPDQINMPTEHILMEGLRQLDELRHMQAKLPPMDAVVSVPRPLEARLRDLEDGELDVFQLVLSSSTVQEVLDGATASDLDAASILAKLIKREYVAVKK